MKTSKFMPLTIFLIAILILLGYSYFIERNIITVKKQIFKVNSLKNNINDKKIVHISDLHFNKRTTSKRIDKIFQRIKEINPEIIFVTGDLIEDKESIKSAKQFVEKISKISPVYIVFGNWDYYVLRSEIIDFKKELENSGANVLMDRMEKIKIGDEEISLIGVDTYTQEIKKINSDENCKILLSHSPSIVYKASEKNIDIVLAGHTHGGQIYIPFITKTIIPVEKKAKKFVAGYYKERETQVYVNPGLGTSTLPLRFLVPPEITVITLEK